MRITGRASIIAEDLARLSADGRDHPDMKKMVEEGSAWVSECGRVRAAGSCLLYGLLIFVASGLTGCHVSR